MDRTPFSGDEILRTTVGSQVHGLAIEGTDDHDEMGVFIEPKSLVIGLDPPMDTYTWRSKPEGVRSEAGDTDYVAYSLRHYLKLAISGNPTVLLPLYAPEPHVLIETKLGSELRHMKNCFLSQESAWRFLRYSEQQYERMHGRGKQNRVPNRPELIERYGWDVKYGSHALRLAFQAQQLIEEAQLTLPMPYNLREIVLQVKTGHYTRDEVAAWIRTLLNDLKDKLETGQTALPPHAARALVSEWSQRAHLEHWSKNDRR